MGGLVGGNRECIVVMDDPVLSLTILFTEFYYWVTIVFMFFIHVGFSLYEVGVSRRKNMKHTLLKNTMVIPLVTVPTWFPSNLISTSFQRDFHEISSLDSPLSTNAYLRISINMLVMSKASCRVNHFYFHFPIPARSRV